MEGQKEVGVMKITRKLSRTVELKIQHAMATGKLHIIRRNATPEGTKEKLDENGTSHSK